MMRAPASMLIDTHSHLDFPDFASDLDAVLARAEKAGITRIITIGTSLEGSRRAIAIAEKHAQVFAVVGVHPNSASEAPEDFVTPLRELARHHKVAGIGETGLDYHRLPSSRGDRAVAAEKTSGSETAAGQEAALADGVEKARQTFVCNQQLDLAVELGLNVVVHERDAWDDTLALLKPYAGRLRAVFHCFGKSPRHARQLFDDGHLVSFTGLVTFKNARDAHAAAAEIPGDSFMVETDCPFLAPVPFRGKRCEPAHTRQVAERIALLRSEPLESVAASATANAEAFFRLTR
jgi:TatD DNase family protein